MISATWYAPREAFDNPDGVWCGGKVPLLAAPFLSLSVEEDVFSYFYERGFAYLRIRTHTADAIHKTHLPHRPTSSSRSGRRTHAPQPAKM